MFAKFSEKLIFYTPDTCTYAHVHTCAYQGVRNISFSENFPNVLNEWSILRPLSGIGNETVLGKIGNGL